MLLVAPVVLGFLIFNIGPILASLVLSFGDYNLLGSGTLWVGLENYRKAFSEPLFYTALSNTFYYCAFRIPLSISLAFLLAVMVKRRSWASTAYRTAIYLPSVIPSVGTAVAWVLLLNPRFGLVNAALRLIGVSGPGWLVDPAWSKPGIILMNLWAVGGTFVIFLAGLQEVPPEYYEAASIDGAGPWHSFWRITVPLMTPTLLFNLVMESIWAFQVFQESFITTGGGPLRSSYFLSLYIYDNAFKYLKMGYASAIAWTLFVIIMVFTLGILRSSGRWVFYGGGR